MENNIAKEEIVVSFNNADEKSSLQPVPRKEPFKPFRDNLSVRVQDNGGEASHVDVASLSKIISESPDKV